MFWEPAPAGETTAAGETKEEAGQFMHVLETRSSRRNESSSRASCTCFGNPAGPTGETIAARETKAATGQLETWHGWEREVRSRDGLYKHAELRLDLGPVCSHVGPACFHIAPACSHVGPACFHLGPACSHLVPACFHFSPACFEVACCRRRRARLTWET